MPARADRRLWRAVAAALVLALGVAVAPVAPAARSQSDANACSPSAAVIGFSDALDKAIYAGTDVGGLSALVYDATQDVYYSLVDNQGATPARVYTLSLSIAAGSVDPRVTGVTTLRAADGAPLTGEDLDAEGIALARDGSVYVASEREPSIAHFSRDGLLLERLPVPERFAVAPDGQGEPNETFESLALSPDGSRLFTAVEAPLQSDGATDDGRGYNRLLVYRRDSAGYAPAAQYVYTPERGETVSDVLAISPTRLLVLERGLSLLGGFSARVFLASLSGAQDVSSLDSLEGADVVPVTKRLLVDLDECPSLGATSPGIQRNPLLDNLEGLALGPRLPDGRLALVLQSDDNFEDFQVTRLIVLALDLGRPSPAARRW
jgi:hypothetical protein